MTKLTLDDELASTLDSAEIRARIFDPSTPDYAFLTLEEVLAAFECTYRTLRNWQKLKDFPLAVSYPGGDGYPIFLIRQFLTKRANIGKKQEIL